MGAIEQIITVVGFLLVMLFVGGLAYFTTRFVGNVNKKRFINSNMKIIEVLNLGFQKYLYLVKIVDKYVVISVTKDRVNVIKELDEKININECKKEEFKNIFKNINNKNKME